MDPKELLPDLAIEEAFKYTNFGNADHRKLLEQGVLKALCAYASGGTLTSIMVKLGLITSKGKVTAYGKRYCYWSLAKRYRLIDA